MEKEEAKLTASEGGAKGSIGAPLGGLLGRDGGEIAQDAVFFEALGEKEGDAFLEESEGEASHLWVRRSGVAGQERKGDLMSEGLVSIKAVFLERRDDADIGGRRDGKDRHLKGG